MIRAAVRPLEDQHPLSSAHLEHQRRSRTRPSAGQHAVPVEVHHLDTAPRRRRRPPVSARSASSVGGRSTTRSTCAAHRLQPLQQRPGDHPVPHVLRPGRAGRSPSAPAADRSAPPPSAAASGATGSRLRLTPAISSASGGPRRVAHQLPRQPQQRRRRRPEHHLHLARAPASPGTHPAPGPTRTPTRTPPRPTRPARPDPRPAVPVHPERRVR